MRRAHLQRDFDITNFLLRGIAYVQRSRCATIQPRCLTGSRLKRCANRQFAARFGKDM